MEQELEDAEWQRLAPFIEPTSYLVGPAGVSRLNARGREVVFIREGYFEQCRRLKMDQQAPQWTSFGLRKWLALCQTGSKEDMQKRGVCTTSAGPVEKCIVTDISYHQITDQRKSSTEAVNETSTASENGMPHIRTANTAIQQADYINDGLSSPESIEPSTPWASADREADRAIALEFGDSEEEEEDEGEFFVRVTLQRLPQPRERCGPVCFIVTHFVDIGVGEWLVPRERYEKTEARPWQEGEEVKMFWAEKGRRGRGQWFWGIVMSFAESRELDPRGSSAWASVNVLWGDNHMEGMYHENCISPWELTAANDSAGPLNPEQEFSDEEVESESNSEQETSDEELENESDLDGEWHEH